MRFQPSLWVLACVAATSITISARSAPAGEAFWYGTEMEAPVAKGINDFLVTQQGPLEVLQQSMMTFDNTGGRTGLQRWVQGKTWDGYTLLSSIGGTRTILIDMQGNVRKTWPLFPFPAKMLPNGDIIGGDPTGRLEGHQEMAALVQMDWCGKPRWQWRPNVPGGARQHHDWQREGNPVGYYAPGLKPMITGGKTLILAHENPPQSETLAVSDIMETEEDVIYEVDADGNIQWKWEPYTHIDQMGFGPVERESIRTQKVGAPEGIGGGFPGTDWQHINSVSYLGQNRWHDAGNARFHPDNIIWDGRSSNIIAIVARYDDPKGQWKSGDIVWRVGPDYSWGRPEYSLGQIIGQHHAHMIPRGLPGAGNILVFDNGGLAGFGPLFDGGPAFWPNTLRNYSRVIEFNPLTLEVKWEYALTAPAGDDRKFFSWYISSAQRLKNGNTLIDEGARGRVFEVTPEGEIVWEYISPFSVGPAFGTAVYRAYRVPEEWVPIDNTCAP